VSGRTLSRVFLRPSDLENMTANGLISLVVNSRLGVVPEPHFKIAGRYSRTVKICLSLGNITRSFSTITTPAAAAAVARPYTNIRP